MRTYSYERSQPSARLAHGPLPIETWMWISGSFIAMRAAEDSASSSKYAAGIVPPCTNDTPPIAMSITAVVVHGGGPQVTQVSERLGIETTFVDGIRVTDAETLDVATMVLAGKLNTDVVASLVTGGVPAVGLSGVDGGLLLARKQSAPDLGFVGEVIHVNAAVLRTLTAQRFVPVVASIAVDETTGQAYNVNADVVASELAIALGAEKLVFINDVPGLIGPTGDLLSELSAAQTLELLSQPAAVGGGMIPKLESAVRALRAGVRRAHLVDGRVEHSLVLELFTPEGVGTMIVPDAEELAP